MAITTGLNLPSLLLMYKSHANSRIKVNRATLLYRNKLAAVARARHVNLYFFIAPAFRPTRRTPCFEVISSRATQLPTVVLKNGLEVTYISRSDVFFLYNEVFVDQVYMQHGITLCPGGTVLDVGANVGLFSIFSANAVGEQGRVIAAEPIPAIFKALQVNAIKHSQTKGTANGSNRQVIETLNVGIADGSARVAEFAFYPRAAGWSTMRPDATDVIGAMEVFLNRSLLLEDSGALPQVPLASLGRMLRRSLPRSMFQAFARLFARFLLERQQTMTCRLMTISDLITTKGLTSVDLLKIDAERAEMDVLAGIEAVHWPLIAQIVLEVHDVHGRLKAVETLLRAKGFQNVVSQQAEELIGSLLFTVYAVKHSSQDSFVDRS